MVGNLGTMPYKWHGGVSTSTAIYGVPSHSRHVLKIDLTPTSGRKRSTACLEGDRDEGALPTVHLLGDLPATTEVMPVERVNEGKYKYGGGVSAVECG